MKDPLAAVYQKQVAAIGQALQSVEQGDRRAVLRLASSAYGRTYISMSVYLGVIAIHPGGIRTSEIARLLGVDNPHLSVFLTKAVRKAWAHRVSRGVYRLGPPV